MSAAAIVVASLLLCTAADWRAAADAFNQVLAIDGENPEAHTFFGLILLQAGYVDDALLAFDRALARDRNYPFGLWAKGLALFDGKQDYAGVIGAWEALMAEPLSEADAERVAQMLTEARKRLSVEVRSAARRQNPPALSPAP